LYVWQGFVAKNPGEWWSLIWELATPANTYAQSISAVDRTTSPHHTTDILTYHLTIIYSRNHHDQQRENFRHIQIYRKLVPFGLYPVLIYTSYAYFWVVLKTYVFTGSETNTVYIMKNKMSTTFSMFCRIKREKNYRNWTNFCLFLFKNVMVSHIMVAFGLTIQ